jgi:DNA processing protein
VTVDAWLNIALTPAVRGKTLAALIERFSGPDGIINAGKAELVAVGLSKQAAVQITDPDPRQLDLCRNWISAPGNHVVAIDDDRYPVLLRNIGDAPPLLFVRGDVEAMSLPQIAIVGSRNATPGGRDTARRFAEYLARNGFSIASGLALGIDGAAHRGALTAGGKTIAVFGAGPDIIYPKAHAGLAEEIVEHGALVSEFPPGAPPRRQQFPQRNRIISGISVGTLIVEASLRSGALVTARCAAEQGREVFAIPGSIHNPTSRGCHRLIRSGAKLVETAEDIVEELPGILAGLSDSIEQNMAPMTGTKTEALDIEYEQLLKLMGWDPVTADTLVNRGRLTADEVCSMLLILELEGRIESLAGGYYIQRELSRST